MESYVLDWLNFLLRWAHVVTAMAWIGASFYFVFLDSNLTPPEDDGQNRPGVGGELWAVHDSGLHHTAKFAASPAQLPKPVHFFYWQSYSTWLTGFLLFCVSYLWRADVYLVDRSKLDWVPWQAGTVAVLFLVVFWLVYDLICRHFEPRKHGALTVAWAVLLLVCVASWLVCHWFAGRAAFLLMGAMLATSMSANLAHWIVPAQRKLVAAYQAGVAVDPVYGERARQRSEHNTYFTLPVLFAMLSGHASFAYSHPQNWLILIMMMLAGVAIRQFFVLRHGFKRGRNRHPWRFAAAGVLLLAGLMVGLRPL